MEYRKATKADHEAICRFFDYWLAGRGYNEHAPGAGYDFFMGHKRIRYYLKKYEVLLAIEPEHLAGIAVKRPQGDLIHLLVAGDSRGEGVGSELLGRIMPDSVREG